MAIATKSLQTYTTELVSGLRLGEGSTPSKAAIGYIASLSFQITRDAVQTGGGHGFVEGLPFKLAFERIQSLNALLALLACAMSETEITK